MHDSAAESITVISRGCFDLPLLTTGLSFTGGKSRCEPVVRMTQQIVDCRTGRRPGGMPGVLVVGVEL